MCENTKYTETGILIAVILRHPKSLHLLYLLPHYLETCDKFFNEKQQVHVIQQM